MALAATRATDPYEHFILDDFISADHALALADDFPDYYSDQWVVYDNVLEKKKTQREWGKFAPRLYSFFQYLCSPTFVQELQQLTGCIDIRPDYGLHGAGLHIQRRGDHLNLHQDYSIHPALKLQRKYNLIVYLTAEWDDSWNGDLELWSHDTEQNAPGARVTSIFPRLGRAVLFDASMMSWHGVPTTICCPENVYRRSLAMYYLTEPSVDAVTRPRARYWPRPEQINDPDIIELIHQRAWTGINVPSGK